MDEWKKKVRRQGKAINELYEEVENMEYRLDHKELEGLADEIKGEWHAKLEVLQAHEDENQELIKRVKVLERKAKNEAGLSKIGQRPLFIRHDTQARSVRLDTVMMKAAERKAKRDRLKSAV